MKIKRIKKLVASLIAAATMITAMAVPAYAEYHAELGEYASDIEIGGEYVMESVKWPGLVAAPDTRPDYVDYITLSKFWSKSPRGANQLWHFTNMDTKTVETPWGDTFEENYSREGYVQISTHYGSYGSNTLRLITSADTFSCLPERYGTAAESQWWKVEKAYKDDAGRQVWHFKDSKGNNLAPGGWSDVYLREVIETDPAQG